jgi:hypothetical protein
VQTSRPSCNLWVNCEVVGKGLSSQKVEAPDVALSWVRSGSLTLWHVCVLCISSWLILVGDNFWVPLVFLVNKIMYQKMWNSSMLKLFPNISVFLEKIQSFKDFFLKKAKKCNYNAFCCFFFIFHSLYYRHLSLSEHTDFLHNGFMVFCSSPPDSIFVVYNFYLLLIVLKIDLIL